MHNALQTSTADYRNVSDASETSFASRLLWASAMHPPLQPALVDVRRLQGCTSVDPFAHLICPHKLQIVQASG